MIVPVSATTENYLKAILAATQAAPDQLVPLGDLAQALDVTPGTVTTMMKSLSGAGLVEYTPRAGVVLSPKGRREAVAIVRRHRLLELFLVEVMGLDWAEVHEEAEVLEHVISDRVLDRMDAILGRPRTDPHGDPIPGPNGELPVPEGSLLFEADAPAHLRILQVDHTEPAFLDYLRDNGLLPGTEVHLTGRNDAAGVLTIRLGAQKEAERTISLDASRKIRVLGLER